MKLFISCDMEGVSGVTDSEDVDPGKAAYKRFRKIMTADVNAPVEGDTGGPQTHLQRVGKFGVCVELVFAWGLTVCLFGT